MTARCGMSLRNGIGWVVVMLGLAVTATSCGAVAERATERAVEKAIENESGGNVDVDLNGSDGGIQVTDDTGQMAIGGGAEIPADFPMPVPSGGEVLFSLTNAGGASVTVQYEDSRYDEIVATYEDHFAGQTDVQRSESSDPRSVSWFSDGGLVSVSDSGDGTVLLNISVGS